MKKIISLILSVMLLLQLLVLPAALPVFADVPAAAFVDLDAHGGPWNDGDRFLSDVSNDGVTIRSHGEVMRQRDGKWGAEVRNQADHPIHIRVDDPALRSAKILEAEIEYWGTAGITALEVGYASVRQQIDRVPLQGAGGVDRWVTVTATLTDCNFINSGLHGGGNDYGHIMIDNEWTGVTGLIIKSVKLTGIPADPEDEDELPDMVLTGIPGPRQSEGLNPNFAGGSGGTGSGENNRTWRSSVDNNTSHIESGGQVGFLSNDFMIRYPNVDIQGGIEQVSINLARNTAGNRTISIIAAEPGTPFTSISNTWNNSGTGSGSQAHTSRVLTGQRNMTAQGWGSYTDYLLDFPISAHEGGLKDIYVRVQGGNVNYGGISLWFAPLGYEDAVDAAYENLTWDNFAGLNSAPEEVFRNLRLPGEGTNGTAIAWTSSDTSVISNAGVVTPRAEGEAPVNVTLTARISAGSAYRDKQFILTVIPGRAFAEVFIDFNDPSSFAETAHIGTGKGDGGDALGYDTPGLKGTGIGVSLAGDGGSAVNWRSNGGRNGLQTEDFLYVFVDDPAFAGVNSAEIEITWWRPSSTAGVHFNYNTIFPGGFSGFEAYREGNIPAAGAGNNWVTNSVKLDGVNFTVGAQNQGAHMRISQRDGNRPVIQSIRITEILPSDEQAVEFAAGALSWDAVKLNNEDPLLVQTNLNLPTSGASQTIIDWTSSAPGIIAVDGTVIRPDNSANVTLTAKISKGSAETEKIFNLRVRGTGADVMDETAVANAKAALTWDVIRRSNITQNLVITDLNLPVTGANYTDIAWQSSNTGAITINGAAGVVTRHASAPASVTLTAAITRNVFGTAVSDTVVFNLTVPPLSDITANVRETIKTDFPTKDYVVSDFIVTDFGALTVEEALAQGLDNFCNRPAFQRAIDAAEAAMGGVVWIPSGNYAFYTTAGRSRSVSLTAGGQSISVPYEIVLDLKDGVQLRGDWHDPALWTEGGTAGGTILEVYAGRGSANSDGYTKGQVVDPQAGNAVRDTYISTSDMFISMNQSTGVTNMTIWYPEQTIENPTPYPWTLYQQGGNSATVENITLINSYYGIYSRPSELHYFNNSYITALATGIQVHICTDIGRIENIRINPSYWADSGLPGAPPYEKILEWTRNNQEIGRNADNTPVILSPTGFKMHRSDWEFVSHLHIEGYQTGIWIGREPGYDDTPNAQFFGIEVKNTEIGLFIDGVNGYAAMFSDSVIGGDLALYVDKDFHNILQFNGVDFYGSIIDTSEGNSRYTGRGVISFESCTFNDYGKFTAEIVSSVTDGVNIRNTVKAVPAAGGYAVDVQGRGNIIIGQSEFDSQNNHVRLGQDAHTLKAVNSGYGSGDVWSRAFDYKNDSTKTPGIGNNQINIQIDSGAQYEFEPIPRGTKTDTVEQPRAAQGYVLRADLPRMTRNQNNAWNLARSCIADRLQEALDFMKNMGGGIVYLPAGEYFMDKPVVVPTGVELRGSFDVQHHTQGGGTAIFTTWAGDERIYGDRPVGANSRVLDETGQPARTGSSAPFARYDAETNEVYIVNRANNQRVSYTQNQMRNVLTGGTGRSLIQLEEKSGLRGLSVVQHNIGVVFGPSYRDGANQPGNRGEYVWEALDAPFLIQGQGPDVYIININIPYGDKGIDLASFDTSRHYVEYFSGQLARAGIWVGGGADGGFIRNWQGNPHYGLRYRWMDGIYQRIDMCEYQFNNYSSLKFGDVTNQTIFNNFVFGAKYGLHFLKDAVSGSNPKSLVAIGHGTDGGTHGMFVENADADTKIITINTKLVAMEAHRYRSYVMMGHPDNDNAANIHPDGQLVMYNSSFWGSPNDSIAVYGGTVRIQQGNFCSPGATAAVMWEGNGAAHIYSSNFQDSSSTRHAEIKPAAAAAGSTVELSNNYYRNRRQPWNTIDNLFLNSVYGSDIGEVIPVELDINENKQLVLTNRLRAQTLSGTIKLTAPSHYAAGFTPVRFAGLDFDTPLVLDLPSYGADRLVFEVTVTGGGHNNRAFGFEVFLNSIYAEYLESGADKKTLEGETPGLVTDDTHYTGEGRPWGGIDDLSMAGSVKWDEDNLYLYLEVTDELHHMAQNLPADIWNGDGIQIGLNMDMYRNKNEAEGGWTQANEIGFAVNNAGISMQNRWRAASGSTNADFAGVESDVLRSNETNLTVYSVKIPWNTMHGQGFVPDFLNIGLSVLVNNSDGGARTSTLEYGIGVNHKAFHSLGNLYLMGSGEYRAITEQAAEAAVDKALESELPLEADMAYNFIAVVENEAVKSALIAKLERQPVYTDEALALKAALEQVSALLGDINAVLAKPRGTNITANLWANALTAFVPRLEDFAEAGDVWDGEETVEIDGITFAAADVVNWLVNVRNIYNLLNAII